MPFAVLMAVLAVSGFFEVSPHWAYPVRTLAVAAVLLGCARPLLNLQPRYWFGSVVLGVAVFACWVAPDLLWPGLRSHWLFHNALTGPSTAIAAADRSSFGFLFFRAGGSVLLVPVVEELFWRAWLMRRLIAHDFASVPLGSYSHESFWLTALLFAAEHGSRWDVGLLAGVAYNWWMVRTRNLGDCVIAHTVTNACLAVYVIALGRWEFWA